MEPKRRASTRLAALVGLAMVLAAASEARAQQGQPMVPSAEQRSGLFTRHKPTLTSRLPVDEDRDVWFSGQWEDRKPRRGLLRPRNSWLNGGMYGNKLSSDCTQSEPGYFMGSTGEPLDCENCEPQSKYGRYFGNFLHPFRPVGSYYAGGSYVPIYDLDPFVPGPGPFPWNHYLSPHTGG
jgi:hypothetical protein